MAPLGAWHCLRAADRFLDLQQDVRVRDGAGWLDGHGGIPVDSAFAPKNGTASVL
jgi:hypothetical protein